MVVGLGGSAPPGPAAGAGAEAAIYTSATLCCLPTTPCGDGGAGGSGRGGAVSCSLVEAPGGCAVALWKARGSWEDPKECPDIVLPTWDDVLTPLFVVPLVALQGVVLLWIVLRLAYAGLARSRVFRSFVSAYIGCNASPLPRHTGLVSCMLYGQITASICTVALFIAKTYLHEVPTAILWMEAVLGGFLFFDLLFSGSKQEFKLSCLLDCGALVDVLTLPGMLWPFVMSKLTHTVLHGHVQWISLTFLRSIQAVLASERLQSIKSSRLHGVGPAEESYEILKTLVRFLALTCCFASLVLVFEVLGEPQVFETSRIATAMGDIDFFTMVYWVMETVTTVGYGDFSPKTLLSKTCTIVGMFAGVAFFTIQVGNILNIMSNQKKGAGVYQKTKRGHIVLVGGGVRHADETLLVAFAQEIFHPAYKRRWPDMVVMSGLGKNLWRIQDMFDQSLERQARDQITYLIGSPLNIADLERCRGEAAKCIYIISDTTGHLDPLEEDKENLIRALSAIQHFPSTPIRLMLLMHDSMEKAVSMGIARHMCFSVNEMKSSLFWQSCRCIGWSSMLSNLMTTTDAVPVSDELEDFPWLADYLAGMDHEIYGLLPAKEFQEESFRHMALEAYRRKGVCIFAAQIDGEIVLAPLRQLQLVGLTVLFAMAADEDMLRGLALESSRLDWREVFARGRAANEGARPPEATYQRDMQSFSIAGLSAQGSCSFESGEQGARNSSTPSKRRFSSSWGVGSWDVGGWGAGSQRTSSNYSPVARQSKPDSVSRQSTAAPQGQQQQEQEDGSPYSTAGQLGQLQRCETYGSCGDSPGSALFHENMLQELECRAARLRANAGNLPFVVVLELTGSWEQLIPFLQQRNAPYLPFRLPLVVLSLTPPTQTMGAFLGIADDESFAFIQGSPFWVPDLERSGVRECSMIVSLGLGLSQSSTEAAGDSGMTGELVSMLDVDVVLMYRMIQNLTGVNRNMLFEFKRTENMRLLPRPAPLSLQDAGGAAAGGGTGRVEAPSAGAAAYASLREPAADAGEPAQGGEAQQQGEEVSSYCDQRYASGQIFTTQVFASLFARTFHSPGAVEVTQVLMTPDVQMASATDYRVSLAWQVKLSPEYEGLTYGELMTELISNPTHPVLPLGIYRMFNSSLPGYGNTGYVWTNPAAETPLLESDMLYVLGDQMFGQMAFSRGLLPMSSDLWQQHHASEFMSESPRSTRGTGGGDAALDG